MSSTTGPSPKSESAAKALSEKASVDDLTERNVELIRHQEESAKQARTRSDLVAEAIAKFCGSLTFFWVHVAWFGVWVVLNVSPGIQHLDPFPFTFLTLVVSLEAIFLSTFILISQNTTLRLVSVETISIYRSICSASKRTQR